MFALVTSGKAVRIVPDSENFNFTGRYINTLFAQHLAAKCAGRLRCDTGRPKGLNGATGPPPKCRHKNLLNLHGKLCESERHAARAETAYIRKEPKFLKLDYNLQ